MTWHVYIVTCSDGSLYCGVTSDMKRRLDEHNGVVAGGAKYTRSRRPVQLAVSISVQDRSEACRVEWLVKRTPRKNKIEFLSQLKCAGSGGVNLS